ncbi:MAG: carboxypeptidase regulatory-like domain-containing protein [Gemmatimonadota bacterium]
MTHRPTRVLLLLAVALCHPIGPLAAQGATIEGSVSLAEGPARRTASRYPTGASAAHPMQSVRAAVFLEIGDRAVAEAADGSANGSSAGAAAPSLVDLVQRDTVFAPSTIAVRAGTVVRFPNADPFFHNVFSYASSVRFDLGRYPEGDSREVRLDRPGIVRVFCEVHEFMRAVILVTDDPYHAVVGDDGTFRMTGVPPGRHTLVAYHPDTGRVERPVSVVGAETVRIDLALER